MPIALGQILLQRRLIDENNLATALAIARNTRTRLGDVLVGQGILGYQVLYNAIAEHFGLACVDLLKSPPAAALLNADLIEEYVQMRALPYQKNGQTITIATAEYTDEVIAWAEAKYGKNISFVITSPVDIHKTVQAIFTQTLTHKSVMGLYESSPIHSARKRTHIALRILAGFGLIILAITLARAPWNTTIQILSVCYALFTIAMIFKMIVYYEGSRRRMIRPSALKNIYDESKLPIYTILIPMYKEVESLPGILKAMQEMDYPVAKLDIKLIFEEDDADTLLAAYALKPQYNFEIIRVPASHPRTKPKACNYALQFARGEYVTVYDADDRPDRKQLKKAVHAFTTAPGNVVCLQSRLNYYNAQDNLLTRLFSLEYAMLFHVLLYGLSRLSMPLMLGGTSNHISLARLRSLGEWDPFNVTEDADLGTRLASQGYITQMLDSDTNEEATNTIPDWIRQRTRWIKGYMQTWLVHMRSPVKLYRALGWRGFAGFQCFVALSSFSYLAAPIVMLLAILAACLGNIAFPPVLYVIAWANLIAYFALHIGTALHISQKYPDHRREMALAAASYPFYLILHSAASYLALWQLIVKPYVWNKTTHGKAKTFEEFQLTRPEETV